MIPADVRRELGIESGRTLRVRREGREIIYSLVGEHRDVQSMLKAARAWAKRSQQDLVEALHERRRRERQQERHRG